MPGIGVEIAQDRAGPRFGVGDPRIESGAAERGDGLRLGLHRVAGLDPVGVDIISRPCSGLDP